MCANRFRGPVSVGPESCALATGSTVHAVGHVLKVEPLYHIPVLYHTRFGILNDPIFVVSSIS